MSELRLTKEMLRILEGRRTVGHAEAAIGQLEQALFLWFHKDDSNIVSNESAIHTLAIAVQGILWTYAHDSRQRPSQIAQGMKKHSVLKDTHNFFKHGNTGRNEKPKPESVAHLLDFTDLILADDASTFGRLFSRTTPLLETYLLRYSLSFPESKISLKTLEI